MREWTKQKTEVNEKKLLKFFNKSEVEEAKAVMKNYDKLETLENKYRAKSWDAYEEVKEIFKKYINKNKNFCNGVWEFSCFSLVYERQNYEIKLKREMTSEELDFINCGFLSTFDEIPIYNTNVLNTEIDIKFDMKYKRIILGFYNLKTLSKFMETNSVAIINMDELKKYLEFSKENVIKLKQVIASQKGKKKIINAHYKEQKRIKEEYEERRRQEQEEDDEYWCGQNDKSNYNL